MVIKMFDEVKEIVTHKLSVSFINATDDTIDLYVFAAHDYMLAYMRQAEMPNKLISLWAEMTFDLLADFANKSRSIRAESIYPQLELIIKSPEIIFNPEHLNRYKTQMNAHRRLFP
jgi:hypothetical protein